MMKQTSKFLSYVLRHCPGDIGITLEPGGWVTVDHLLAQSEAHGTVITRAELETIIATSDKKRFTLSEDGTRIRAAQGHSVDVALGLQPSMPPEYLFHGTAEHSLAAIRAQGLKPRNRQQVHLSADVPTASAVGSRHGKPHVLRVQARKMKEDGYRFYQADNGVWLTDTVPTGYLDDVAL